MEADYPPPPAQIERVIPRQHENDACVWVDGTWQWNTGRWRWLPGSWVVPPTGCYYAPAESFWGAAETGAAVLYYRVPAWYRESATGPQAQCPAPQPCSTIVGR